MHSKKNAVAIVGRGVSGLTCAETFLENGIQVDIFSRDDLPLTSSMAAGAYWWPHKAYPADKVGRWSMESFKKYKNLAQLSGSGIHMHDHFRFCSILDETDYVLQFVDDWESIDGKDYGIECIKAFRVHVPLIDVSVYMPWLEARVKSLGAGFVYQEIASLSELTEKYDTIINCSGLGALKLVDDREVFPIRGQVIKVTKPEGLKNSYRHVTDKSFITLVLPRENDCVLGGTSLENDWDSSVNPDFTQEILERCIRLVPELKESRVLSANTGLRPGRREVRLEKEQANNGAVIIHNYGHGGSGYTISYGCAKEVLELYKGL